MSTMTLNTPVSMETMTLNTTVTVPTMTLNTPVTIETMTINTPTMTLNTPVTVPTMILNTPTMTLNTPISVPTMTLETPAPIATVTLNIPAPAKEPLSRRSSTPLPHSPGHPGHRALRQSASYNLGDPHPGHHGKPQSDPQPQHRGLRQSASYHLGDPHPGHHHGKPQSDPQPQHRGLRQSASYHLGDPHPGHHHGKPLSDGHGRAPQPQHRGLCQSSSYHHGDRAHHWSSGSESEAEEAEEEDDAHSDSGGSSQSECTVYYVVLLGDHGVGKSTLAGIFAGRTDGEESGELTYERTLAVDGQDTTLIVMDTWDNEKLEEEDSCMKVGSAYVIVYSITDRSSFDSASELRIQLRRMRQADKIPIILVGNKSDLVRSREVAVEEGRACAVVFDCKFIETSASLQHNVAELFEGVVRQIRLHRNHADREERVGASGHRRRPNGQRKDSVTQKARRFLDRLVARNKQRSAAKARSKSCHDLAVL